jgi:hypothetical protein
VKATLRGIRRSIDTAREQEAAATADVVAIKPHIAEGETATTTVAVFANALAVALRSMENNVIDLAGLANEVFARQRLPYRLTRIEPLLYGLGVSPK